MHDKLLKALEGKKLRANGEADLGELVMAGAVLPDDSSTPPLNDAISSCEQTVHSTPNSPLNFTATCETGADILTPTSADGSFSSSQAELNIESTSGNISSFHENELPPGINIDGPPVGSFADDAGISDTAISATQAPDSTSFIDVVPPTPEVTAPKFTVRSGAVESDIISAMPSTILLFGNGLQMKIVSKSRKYFQYRYCLDGKSSTRNLGNFSDMNFAQAREEAEKCRAALISARKKKRDAEFKTRLKKPKAVNEWDSNKYSAFLTMEDAGFFSQCLMDRQNSMDSEIYYFFRLLILIPTKPNVLLGAHWKDFYGDTPRFSGISNQWIIEQPVRIKPKNIKVSLPKIAYLSELAIKLLNNMGSTDVNTCNPREFPDGIQPLFPKLYKMDKAVRDKLLDQTLRSLWSSYVVDIDGFRYFFEKMAKNNSFFKPELVDAVVANKVAPSKTNERSFNLQKQALANWWAAELEIFSAYSGVETLTTAALYTRLLSTRF